MGKLSASVRTIAATEASSSEACAAPIAPSGRIVVIDSLRGLAVLGILLINIQVFAMPEVTFATPFAFGTTTRLDQAIWLASYLIAYQKFMTIFSILFGAGILLMSDRLNPISNGATAIIYRRLGFLGFIGLLHAYFIWSGDILVAYGICGAVAFACHRLSSRALTLIAVVMLSIATVNLIGSQMWLPEQHLLARLFGWLPSAMQPAEEIAAYRGSWASQLHARIAQSLIAESYLFGMYVFWRVTGLMLLGMALFRWGFFQGRCSSRVCWTLIVAGLAVGMPATLWGLHFYSSWGWSSVEAGIVAQTCNSIGSIPISFALMGAILLCSQLHAIQPTINLLSKIGRMAFTNYLCQSVICTAIFYGCGLRRYAEVGRSAQFACVLGIWFIQIVISDQWLKHFRFGPLEWVWRSVSYLRLQPFRRVSVAS